MANPSIVVVLTDESYLAPMESKLVESIGGRVDIELISDMGYFREYFLTPKTKNLLIIDESLYSPKLLKHNIDKIVVLTEEAEAEKKSEELRGQVTYAFKYLSLSMLLKSIIPAGWTNGMDTRPAGKCKLITVISPEGGAGCTTIAAGICACMAQSSRRTLLTSVQAYQDYHFFMKVQQPLPLNKCFILQNADKKIYAELRDQIRTEIFSYLPALPSSIYALSIPAKSLISFAAAAQRSGDYDCVVVDAGSHISPTVISLMEQSDHVIIVSRQDDYAAFRLKVLEASVNCKEAEKYMLVCNGFNKNQENALLKDGIGYVSVQQYIERLEPEIVRSVKALTGVQGIQELAYAVM